MNNNVLVKMAACGGFISFQTYSRGAGKNGRFLFGVDFLRGVLEDGKTRYDKDCYHYATVYRDGDNLSIRFLWLHEIGGRKFEGIEQRIAVPTAVIYYLIECDTLNIKATAKHLSADRKGGAKINAKNAQSVVHNIAANGKKRRALSKALRDCFQWPGEIVKLWKDGRENFYITTDDAQLPLAGGLILHKGEGLTGGYRYAVHT